jgi:hypothetical protein
MYAIEANERLYQWRADRALAEQVNRIQEDSIQSLNATINTLRQTLTLRDATIAQLQHNLTSSVSLDAIHQGLSQVHTDYQDSHIRLASTFLATLLPALPPMPGTATTLAELLTIERSQLLNNMSLILQNTHLATLQKRPLAPAQYVMTWISSNLQRHSTLRNDAWWATWWPAILGAALLVSAVIIAAILVPMLAIPAATAAEVLGEEATADAIAAAAWALLPP